MRPILHISTADDQTLAELITPEQIALGYGDDYLLQINDFFATTACPPTSGRSASRTAASTPGPRSTATAPSKAANTPPAGTSRPSAGSPRSCAAARPWQGSTRPWPKSGCRRCNRTKGPTPTALPAAPVSIIWSQLPGGSPRVKGNFPGNYWPGRRWVDWVGTDFYSAVSRLERPQPLLSPASCGSGKPVAITEWAVSGEDEPRFVKQLVAWTVKRPRVRMLVYYNGFGPGNPYDLGLYPRTRNTLRKKIRRANFLPYADYNAGLFPPLPAKTKKP